MGKTIFDILDDDHFKAQVQAAASKSIDPDKLIRMTRTIFKQDEKLQECTVESLQASVLGCAQVGLYPDPLLHHCYIEHRWNKNIKPNGAREAGVKIEYRGWLALAYASGKIHSVCAQAVYENDHFSLEYGTNEHLAHRPEDSEERGKFKGAYAMFRYHEGPPSFDYMTKAEIEKLRNLSSNKDRGAWKEHYAEMAKTKPIRRHCKVLNLSPEIAAAIGLEDQGYYDANGAVKEAEPAKGKEGDTNVKFMALASPRVSSIAEEESLSKFIAITAEANDVSQEDLKASAVQNFDAFWAAFEKWIQGGTPGTQRKEPAKEESSNKDRLGEMVFEWATKSEIAIDIEDLDAWCKEKSEANNVDVEVLCQKAIEQFDYFCSAFKEWLGKRQPAKRVQPAVKGPDSVVWWNNDKNWKFGRDHDAFVKLVNENHEAVTSAMPDIIKSVKSKYDRFGGEYWPTGEPEEAEEESRIDFGMSEQKVIEQPETINPYRAEEEMSEDQKFQVALRIRELPDDLRTKASQNLKCALTPLTVSGKLDMINEVNRLDKQSGGKGAY